MRASAVVRALGALAVLLLLVGGLPALLATAIGNPAAGWADLAAGDVTDAVLIDVLAAVAWLAWAQLAVATVVEGWSALRRTPMPRRIPLVLPGQQQLARVLVTALLLTPVAAGAVLPTTPYARAAATTTSPGAQPSRPAVTWTVTPTGGSPHGLPPQADHDVGRGKQAAARHAKAGPVATPTVSDRADPSAAVGTTSTTGTAGTRVYVVPAAQGPATYWDLAQTWLGSGERWPEIWHLNEGRTQADGAVMTSPRLLRPGWTVLLPEPHQDNGAPRVPAVASAPADQVELTTVAAEVTVRTGDTLSQIAADHGQADWHRTWDANAGRSEPDGARYTNPDLIRPGWKITVPPDPDPHTDPHTDPHADARADLVPAPSPSGPALAPKLGPHPLQDPLQESLQDTVKATQPAASELAKPVMVHPSAEPRPEPRDVMPPRSLVAPELTVPDHGSATGAASPAARPPGTEPDAPSPPVSPGTSGTLPMVAFAGGGGALLAGLLLTALRRHRRRQFRDRRLGRTIAATPPDLAPVEKALLARGPAGTADLTWLNAALRGLVHSLAPVPGSRLPDVIAVRMTHDLLELVLTTPHRDPPKPWQAAEDGLRWSLLRSDQLPYDPADAVFHYAPYPALVTVGSTAAGDHWLLDLEQIGALTLTGDLERCTDLGRFLAAELAHNSWSEQLHVTLAGFGAELRGLNPSRIRQLDNPAEVRATTAALQVCLLENQQVAEQAGVDVLTGRLRNIHGDVWAPQVLLISPPTNDDRAAAAGDVDRDPNLQEDGLSRLLEALHTEPSRKAIALVLISGDPNQKAADSLLHDSIVEDGQQRGAGWRLHLASDGTFTIPALGVQVRAQQLPAGEAADLAALLALAADGNDRPVPAARGEQPWDAYADAAGSPRPDLTVPRSSCVQPRVDTIVDLTATTPVVTSPAAGLPVTGSVLPLPGSVYLQRAATTAPDLDTLAPTVSAAVRSGIRDADPDLDADLAAWHDPASQLPKLRLLGPISLTAGGQIPDKRPAFYTELVAYLAARPHGATLEQFACDLWPDDPAITGKTTPRQAASVARTWLGMNPKTGQHYLPKAADVLPGVGGGVGTYRVQGLLVDAELFRRLRLRGTAAGPVGIADLQAALDLVTGAPLAQRRPDGYRWLVDLPLDHEYTGMIVDVAHVVATHHLANNGPDLAAAAANVALLAGAQDDVALLDLVAACDATGNSAEADRYVKRILANHDAEVEEDLPARTYEVLRHRSWLPQSTDRVTAS
jgi:hypothetical protein